MRSKTHRAIKKNVIHFVFNKNSQNKKKSINRRSYKPDSVPRLREVSVIYLVLLSKELCDQPKAVPLSRSETGDLQLSI